MNIEQMEKLEKKIKEPDLEDFELLLLRQYLKKNGVHRQYYPLIHIYEIETDKTRKTYLKMYLRKLLKDNGILDHLKKFVS